MWSSYWAIPVVIHTPFVDDISLSADLKSGYFLQYIENVYLSLYLQTEAFPVWECLRVYKFISFPS